jgi:hypothetical protein
MSALLGQDYAGLVGSSAPAGLLSDPADYPRCVAAAKTIKLKSRDVPVPSQALLMIRCRQLHTAVKEQALSYLIGALWRVEEGAELGQSVSDREVSSKLQETASKNYPSPAAFRRHLASIHWSVADERYAIKSTLLDAKFLKRLEQRSALLGGSEQALARIVRESVAKWSAKTHCSPGYTAWQCRPGGLSGHGEADPSASVAIEKLAGV